MGHLKNTAVIVAALVTVGLASLLPAYRVEAAPAKPAFGAYHPAVAYPDTIRQSFYLPMRDGVRETDLVVGADGDGASSVDLAVAKLSPISQATISMMPWMPNVTMPASRGSPRLS